MAPGDHVRLIKLWTCCQWAGQKTKHTVMSELEPPKYNYKRTNGFPEFKSHRNKLAVKLNELLVTWWRDLSRLLKNMKDEFWAVVVHEIFVFLNRWVQSKRKWASNEASLQNQQVRSSTGNAVGKIYLPVSKLKECELVLNLATGLGHSY